MNHGAYPVAASAAESVRRHATLGANDNRLTMFPLLAQDKATKK